MTKTICIYKDKGVGPLGFKALLQSLKESPVTSGCTLKILSAKDVLDRKWALTCDLIIFPGGQDIPYHRALKGEGTRILRQYVEKGGRYLGICAGAYFASSEIEFEKDKAHHVVQKRELGFFPGKAIGVIYDKRPFCYRDESAVHAALISTFNESFNIYYLGGCYFKEDRASPKFSTLAQYQDANVSDAKAIVFCQYGQGQALLSGVHFEIPVEFISKNHPDYAALEKDEPKRKELFDRLLSELLS